MWLVSLHIRWGVAINGIFGLKWRYYGTKGGILDYCGTLMFWSIILFYPIKGYNFIDLKQCVW